MKEKMEKILEWIYLIDSEKKWNITTIMVWVHWNEISWVKALDEIKSNLELISWKVYFVYANQKAIKKNVRFTEKNLNRCFLKNNNWNTYEEKRAKEIIDILEKSDYLLDIHNTTSFNSSLEFLITTHIDYAKYFNVNKVVSHIDDIQKWWSDWFMDSIWKKWFCLECGSINYWDKEKSKILAKKSILNFLKVTKNISWEPEVFDNDKLIIKMKLMYKTKSNDFKLAREFKDFEEIKRWELIWIDWKEKIINKQDSIILFAHNRKQVNSEWFCLGVKL